MKMKSAITRTILSYNRTQASIIKLVSNVYGFQLYVPQYGARHYSISVKEMREWMECYAGTGAQMELTVNDIFNSINPVAVIDITLDVL